MCIFNTFRAHRARCFAIALASVAPALASAASGADIIVGSGNTLTVGGLTGSTLAGFSGFTANGTAIIDSGQASVQLTANLNSQSGSIWTTAPQSLTNANGFSVNFTYTAAGDRAADGATFTLQNDPAGAAALGAGGPGLGYQNILNSASYQINLFIDPGSVLNTAGQTGHTGGNPYQSTGTGVNFTSGNPIAVNLSYANGVLVERLTDTVTGGVYSTDYALDLNAVLSGTSARLGFTGGTGGLDAIQTISNFSFTSGPGASQVVSGDHLLVSAGGTVIGTSGTLNVPIWNISGGVVAIAGTVVNFNTFTQSGGFVSLGNITLASGNFYTVQGGASSLVNLNILAGGSLALAGGSLTVSAFSNAGNISWTAGTIHFTGTAPLTIDGTTLGANPTLNPGMSLTVNNTTAVPANSQFTLNGGNFSTGSLSNAGIVNLRSGNFTLAKQDLEVGDSGQLGPSFIVGPGLNTTVNQTTHVAQEGELAVVGGSHTSSFVVNDGTISVLDGSFTASFQSINNSNFDAIRSFINFGTDVHQMVNFGTMNLVDSVISGDLHNTVGSQLRTNGDVVFNGLLSSDTPVSLAGSVELVGQNNNLLGISGSAQLFVRNTGSLTSDGITLTGLQVEGSVTLRSSASGGAYTAFATGHGTTSLAGTSKVTSLTFGPVGVLNLMNNALIVEATTGTKASLIQQIAADVTSAHITSSTAATNPAYGVVVVDNADLGATTFGGIAVDVNSIIVTQALLGDANLDGVVNPTDLLIWSHNFNNTGSYSVTSGDFNNDGVVNPTDLLIWAHAFNNSIGAGAPSIAAGSLSGISPVPEPSSLLLLSVPLMLLMRRTRQKCPTC